jgi:hypothetical protein
MKTNTTIGILSKKIVQLVNSQISFNYLQTKEREILHLFEVSTININGVKAV